MAQRGRPKLVENMTAEERVQHWRAQSKARKAQRLENLQQLGDEQLAAIAEMIEATEDIRDAFSYLSYPTYNDVVRFNDAFCVFKREMGREED